MVNRPKPSEYVYTETEVLGYKALEERIAALEGNSDADTPGGANIDVTAKPGQMIIVKEVDESGKPTAWKAVDRTHWVDDPKETVLFDGTVTISDMSSVEEFPVYPTVGTEYTVVINGETYKAIGVADVEGVPVVGNLSIWWPDEYAQQDNGLPFAIGDGWFCVNGDDGNYTVTLSATIAEVHKIDPKYIEDMYHTEPDQIETMLEEQSLDFTHQPSTWPYDRNDAYGYGHTIADFVYADHPPIADGDALAETFDTGMKFIVNWDGVRYDCVCSDGDGMEAFVLGNAHLYSNVKADTGEPFCIIADAYFDTQGLYIIANDASASHTLGISYASEAGEVHQIPEKYIPNHSHSAEDIQDGEFSLDRIPTLTSDKLPVVPIVKGGTGATTVSAARGALGIGIGYCVSSNRLDITTMNGNPINYDSGCMVLVYVVNAISIDSSSFGMPISLDGSSVGSLKTITEGAV